MALQYAGTQSCCHEDDLHFSAKPTSLSSTFNESDTISSGAFECNICLDLVQDPVVTFCGHLYCWPCIYKWITSRRHDNPQCPVCKTDISDKTLIPLYGRGKLPSKEDSSRISPRIPKRPKCDQNAMLVRNVSPRPAQRLSYVQQSQPYYLDNNTAAPLMFPQLDPAMGMFGEMVYARFFGNSETTSSYHHLGGSSNRRLRRYIIEADTSLSRIFFFLCCCVVLCLVLF